VSIVAVLLFWGSVLYGIFGRRVALQIVCLTIAAAIFITWTVTS
jgi:hypothetical protein